MRQRIFTLTRYFLRHLLTSISGVLYMILTLAYWLLLFNPQQETPEVAYYILVIGAFGAGMAFLITLTIATKANQAENYPWIVRLSSRVEYVTAVLLSTLIATVLLQLLLALLSLFRGPSIPLGRILEIPPIWLSLIIIATTLAMHASDFIAAGWSRIYVYGILAIFLFGQGINNQTISAVLSRLSRTAVSQGWADISNQLNTYANSVSNGDTNIISRFFGFVFWPFRALLDATIAGHFTVTQALAPAILLLYATILFMLAADFFATKDLMFTE